MSYLFLFDIDGTILKLNQYRSKEFFKSAFKEIYNLEVSIEKMPDFSGMTDLQIIYDICESVSFPYNSALNKINEFWEYLIPIFDKEIVPEKIKLMPYINECIDFLNQFSNAYLGIVTGNFRENAILKLNSYNLAKHFEIGAYGCENRFRNYLPPLALDRAKQKWEKQFVPENTIIIGDSPKDIHAAKSNNMMSIAIATGFCGIDELEKYSPDYLVADLSNHKDIINQIIK